MKQKIYDLKNKRSILLNEAEAALKEKNMDLYNEKMNGIKTYNAEIQAMEDLLAERGLFDEKDSGMVNRAEVLQNKKTESALQNKMDAARSGNEYANAFAEALRSGSTIENGKKNESLKPLYNALTIGGGTPEGADGGFLVPVDFDNMIHRKMKDLIRLADYFNIENVTTYSGWRAVETSAIGKPMQNIDEMAVIPKDDQPSFSKVTYKVSRYSDRVAVSNELMSDNTAGLMQYLSEWFAKRVVITENTAILALLETLTPTTLTAGKEIAELKSALNKELNTAHSRNAVILANQSSYDFLDQQVDANGRGLLVPNPADQDVYRFKNRPVIPADDDLVPSRVVKTGNNAGTYHPIYIGCFKAFATLFRRQAMEFAATNIGGDAWATNSYEVRGIMRMDLQKVDPAAAIKKEITETAGGTASDSTGS